MYDKNNKSKKKKIIAIITVTAIVVLALVLAAVYLETRNTDDSVAESGEETETTVCWIAETEKEKALAMQEYIANSLIELAEAEEVNIDIDGGVDEEEIEDTEEEATTESSSGSSSTSSTSSSTSNSSSSSSSGNKSTSSSSSSSSSSSKSSSSSSSSSSHKHSYTGKVTKAATCTSTGTMTYTCSCGASYTETIAKTDHTWVEYTYTETVHHNAVYEDYEYITDCGFYTNDYNEFREHWENDKSDFAVWNGLIRVQDAYDEEVTKTGYKCSVCGATK